MVVCWPFLVTFTSSFVGVVMEDGKSKRVRVPKAAKIKNKMPAEIQVTAEQLLQEANSQQIERVSNRPRQKVADPEELAQIQLSKRKEFEDNIRKNRSSMPNWIKYARWEESQQQFERSRSIFERALDVDHRCITLWLKYAEMEMKHKQVNHARNVWDRAVAILPRANQFWYKYSYMEEMLGNIAGARRVFERWMEWEPEPQAWLSYIKMELRYKEYENVRNIYERFIQVYPQVKNWIRYAKFEDNHGCPNNARNVYERAIEFFGDEFFDQQLYIAFATFEESHHEYERARIIYKYSIEKYSYLAPAELIKVYTNFEKKHGDRSGIENVIVSKRKVQLEADISSNSLHYDSWFDYLHLMEENESVDSTREVYERAIANVPPIEHKQAWRRYIYLWIRYCLYEELVARDVERTRQVYRACLEIIPHSQFTFSKIWIMYAHFEIRQKMLSSARKALGTAIGKCPKSKLFKAYIELELQLREFDRCRKLYEKMLQIFPNDCSTWVKYAELEHVLGDVERARAIFDLAIQQDCIDMPEVLWKAYIDFEIGQGEAGYARSLYEDLLQKSQHVKVFLSYADFETSFEHTENAREVFKRGDIALRNVGKNEERLMLLNAWIEFETSHGTTETKSKVASKLPQKVKKKRKLFNDAGLDSGWEEYWDYVFPDEEGTASSLKLLEVAKFWKQNQNN